MFRFENPLDPSKDGQNPIIDGIRYNIRNSESIKEEILSNLDYFISIAKHYEMEEATDILDMILSHLGYTADDLIIADEHEIIDKIYEKMSWLG